MQRSAKKDADDILKRFHIDKPPTPVLSIAALLGIPIRIVSDPQEPRTIDGHRVLWPCPCIVDDGCVSVLGDPDDAWVTKFRIAHGMAHALTGVSCVCTKDMVGSPEDEEWRASEFAAQLLLPSWLIESYSKRASMHGRRWWQVWKGPDDMLYERMAMAFGANAGAIMKRCYEVL